MEGINQIFADITLGLKDASQLVSLIFLCVILYFGLLWIFISVWVYNDAKKRYDSKWTPILFGVSVFVLNIPMLVFYYAVRPDMTFEEFDDWEAGGVNVPIVNFMGKEGVEMSLELRVNPKKLGTTPNKDAMSVEIGWDNQNEKFRLIDRQELLKEILAEDKDNNNNKQDLKVENQSADVFLQTDKLQPAQQIVDFPKNNPDETVQAVDDKFTSVKSRENIVNRFRNISGSVKKTVFFAKDRLSRLKPNVTIKIKDNNLPKESNNKEDKKQHNKSKKKKRRR